MKYKCIIFDLDGTLLESLEGILKAVNDSFKELGYNVSRTYEQGKHYIGAGALLFARRAMNGLDFTPGQERELMDHFLTNYSKTQSTMTKPFNGVNEMLESLQKEGLILTIASNKPQMLLDPIVNQLFPNIKFGLALGQRPNKPEKPDPFCVFEIMKKYNLKPEEVVYVGDSEYDYKTAHNAGIDCVICKFGYGFYTEPWFTKVKYSVNSIDELEKFLKN